MDASRSSIRPALALTIGVTGHRADTLTPSCQPLVAQKLAEAFVAIENACSDELKRDRDKGDRKLFDGEAPQLRLVSCLASGSDILAAEAIPKSWRLDALLPFDREIYASNDFKPDANGGEEGWRERFEQSLARADAKGSTTILPLPRNASAGDTACYREAGAFMVSQIDILVAVWSGEKGRGAGGTQWVVEQALTRGVPVVWIDDKGSRAAWQLLRLEEDGAPVSPQVDATVPAGPIAAIVASQLAVPNLAEGKRDSVDNETQLADFLMETPRKRTWCLAYSFLDSAARGQRPRIPLSVESKVEWDAFAAAMPVDASVAARIGLILKDRFRRADALAAFYGHRYRSAYIIAYILSAVAVLIAVTGTFRQGVESDRLAFSATIEAIGELATILTIAGLVVLGIRGRWHQRWLEYRALAELLRHLRFLAHVGEYGAVHRLATSGGASSGAWIHWYVRAAIRELGLPGATLSREYQWALLNAVKLTEIEAQIDYHRKNAKAMRRLQGFLHLAGIASFLIVFAGLLLFVGVWAVTAAKSTDGDFLASLPTWLHLPRLKATTAFLGAVLPALGAALAGIRFTGDFEGFGERSKETAAALADLSAQVDLARERLDLATTDRLVGSISSVMAEDVAGWRSIYGRKYLEIPA